MREARTAGKWRIGGIISAVVIGVACLFATLFISGAATTDEGEVSEPTIISKNISYDAELYTCYAVPCESVASGAEVSLQVLNAEAQVVATVTEYSIETVWGKPCYVFKGLGTSPRNIGVKEYVKAVTSDGGESAITEYSVLEYLCQKLTKEAYLNYTPSDGAEYTRRALYLQLLKYASSAEALLGSDADIALSDVCYVGGKYGTSFGFTENGASAVLDFDETKTPLYSEFIEWNVYRYDLGGNLIESYIAADGEEIEASGFVCAVPEFATSVPDGVTAIFDNSHVTFSVMTEDQFSNEYAVAEALCEALSVVIDGTGFVEIVYGELSDACDVNIIIGESDSLVSQAAYTRLSEVRSKNMYSEAKYVIVSESGEIAVAYDPNEYTELQTVDYAVAELLELFALYNGVLFAEDFIKVGELDLIEIQRAADMAKEDAEWKDLLSAAAAKYGETRGAEVVAAIKEYYSLRSDNLIVWYASLYDPGIGGFYAATSARMYEGFMPLLETTGQLLGHLSSYGVFSAKGNSTKNALPEHIKAQIIYYAKSCQDPESGYFYNPQLGKEVSDRTVVRRGRDLSRVTSMLSSLGSKPTYDCPNGTKGDGITAEEYWASTGLPESLKPYVPASLAEYEEYLDSLTPSLSSDTEQAIASLMAYTALTASESASDSEAYLKTHANFDAYLGSKMIDSNPYSVGNEFNGTYKLIQVASDKLGAYASAEGVTETPWYEGMTLCDMLIRFMTDHINSKGLFGTISEGSTDELEGIRFENANGFFKMITIYNAWNVEYPEPMLAAKGLLASIKGDEPSTGNVCNVYNSWNALSSLITNVNKTYADSAFTAEQKAEVIAYINDALGADGPAAISNSYNKQKAYQCADGTFSNSVSNSVANFPGGLPAGLGIKEGNVDAIGFGFTATMNSIYSVMGLSSAAVSYYHEYNYLMFLETILNVEPVSSKIKYTVDDKDFVSDFEDYDPALNMKIVSLNKGGEGNTLELYDDGGNTVVKVTKVSGTTAATVGQFYTYKESGATKMVFGARLKIVELSRNSQIQFSIGGSSVSPFMALCQTKSTAQGAIVNVNGYESKAVVGGWFDIRIEYRITGRDAEGSPTSFRADTYINESLVYTTTTLYNTASTRRILELDEFDRLTVSFNQPNVGVFYVDDLYMHRVAE